MGVLQRLVAHLLFWFISGTFAPWHLELEVPILLSVLTFSFHTVVQHRPSHGLQARAIIFQASKCFKCVPHCTSYFQYSIVKGIGIDLVVYNATYCYDIALIALLMKHAQLPCHICIETAQVHASQLPRCMQRDFPGSCITAPMLHATDRVAVCCLDLGLCFCGGAWLCIVYI